MNEHGLDINENDMKSLIKIAIDFYEYELDVMVNNIYMSKYSIVCQRV